MRKPDILKWETEFEYGGRVVLTVEPEDRGNLEAKLWVYRKSVPGVPETPTIIPASLTDLQFLMKDLADCAEVLMRRGSRSVEV